MKEMWDGRYKDENYFYGTEPNQFLTNIIEILPEKSRVLCIAEGEGRNAVYLAQKGHDVTAVDFSSEGKKKAEALAQKKGVSIKYDLSPLEDYDFGMSKWDAVISIFCHLPTSMRPSIHQKIESSLKRGGVFIIQGYTVEQLDYKTGGPQDPSMLYSEAILRQEFSHLNWIKLQRKVTDIHEGKGHSGLSSVINGIGFKSC